MNQNQSNSNSQVNQNQDALQNQSINAEANALENGAEINAIAPMENKVEDLGFGENPKLIDEAELPQNTAVTNAFPTSNVPASTSNGTQGMPGEIVNQALEAPSEQDQGQTGSAVQSQNEASLQPQEPISLEPLVTNEFTGAPLFPGSIKAFAEGEAPEFYKVEPGDTLIDVCDQLLDEPGYWPKLWSYNPEIKNPHYIWPGMRLKFYAGDDANPPYLQISNAEPMVPKDTAGLSMATLVESPFQIAPLPEKKVEPGFAIDPDSVIDVLDVTTDSSDIDFYGAPFVPVEIQVNVPAFIFDDTKSPLGTVFMGEDSNINSGVGSQVIIEDEDGLTSGTTYSVLRYSGKVRTYNDNDSVGYRYEYAGKITMMNKMNDDDYFLAQVIEADRGIQSGDIIVPYIANRRSVPISDQYLKGNDANGEIVGFDFEESQIGATGNFVFIAGSNSPVGSLVNLYRNTFGFTSTGVSNGLVNMKYAATARILDVSAGVATGYIVSSQDAVAVGDRASSR